MEEVLNFLELVPVRAKEHIEKDWQVGFEVPRFQSRFWRWFFVHLGATENYIVRLDRMGSEIWGYIDGERSVRDVLALLELHHPEEEGLKDRLLQYLRRLDFHGFIRLKEAEEETGEEKESARDKEE